MEKEKIFKVLYPWLQIDEPFISVWVTLPESVNTCMEDYVDFLVDTFPKLYTKDKFYKFYRRREKMGLFESPDELDNLLKFIDITGFILEDYCDDYRDIYFLAEYLEKHWSSDLDAFYKDFMKTTVDMHGDPYFENGIKYADSQYKKVDRLLNDFR